MPFDSSRQSVGLRCRTTRLVVSSLEAEHSAMRSTAAASNQSMADETLDILLAPIHTDRSHIDRDRSLLACLTRKGVRSDRQKRQVVPTADDVPIIAAPIDVVALD